MVEEINKFKKVDCFKSDYNKIGVICRAEQDQKGGNRLGVERTTFHLPDDCSITVPQVHAILYWRKGFLSLPFEEEHDFDD